MAEKKLDIFELLRQINRGKLDIWDNLTEQQRKEFSPFMTMRWMIGTDDQRQVFFVNELVNPHLFVLQKHPELLLKLMAICASGEDYRYKFFKPANAKGAKSKPLDVIREYYGYPTRQAKDAYNILTNDDILAMATELGYQKEDMRQLKNDLKGRK